MSNNYQSVLEQYEKNKKAANSSRFSSQEERLKKYFTTVLPKGVDSGEKRIRILPTKDGSTPFVEVFFHDIMVNGEWVKLFDPKQEGKRSPLNETRDGLLLTGKESDKILARNYQARKFYIVKVIDRDHEEDGPKFWRFKHHSKNAGVLDKIFPLFKNKGDITDPKTGRDLIITMGLATSNNGKSYTTITSIIPEDVTLLHEDEKKSEEWLNDDLVWSDVYSKKPEEYLVMVANGETPKWDTDLKKWVSLSSEETTIMAPESETSTNVETDLQDEEPESDDLPF